MSPYPQRPTFPIDMRKGRRTSVSRVGAAAISIDVDDGVMDNLALAPMPARTVKVNTADSDAAPQDLSLAQLAEQTTFKADSPSAVSVNIRDQLRERVSVTQYGASRFGTAAANKAAIQKCLDENPTAHVIFPSVLGEFASDGEIMLSDGTGRFFKGDITFDGAARINFPTIAADAARSDGLCGAGFRAITRYTTDLSAEIGGLQGGRYRLNCYGPANGHGLAFANCINVDLGGSRFDSMRYGIVLENCIQINCDETEHTNFTNAGIGILAKTGNPNVYIRPESVGSWYNDTISLRGVKGTSNYAAIALILDHGTQSYDVRILEFSHTQGPPGRGGVQHLYAGRAVSLTARRCWAEAIRKIIYIPSPSDTGNMPGVFGALPSGTYPLSAFPASYCYEADIQGLQIAEGAGCIDVSGVFGPVVVRGFRTQKQIADTAVIEHREGGNSRIVDLGGHNILSPVTPTGSQVAATLYKVPFAPIVHVDGPKTKVVRPSMVTGTGTTAVSLFNTTAALLNPAAGNDATVLFPPEVMPADFNKLVSAKLYVASDETGNLYWDAFPVTIAPGQAYDSGSTGIGPFTTALTAKVLTTIDVTGGFGALAAGRYAGFEFRKKKSSANDTTTNLRIYALVFVYY